MSCIASRRSRPRVSARLQQDVDLIHERLRTAQRDYEVRYASKKKTETEGVDAGSGDVLVDLGFPDADERRLRVQLAMRLNELVAASRLTQARAAELFGIPQPHVSEL